MIIACPECNGPFEVRDAEIAPLVQVACPHCEFKMILDFAAANDPSLIETGMQMASGFRSATDYRASLAPAPRPHLEVAEAAPEPEPEPEPVVAEPAPAPEPEPEPEAAPEPVVAEPMSQPLVARAPFEETPTRAVPPRRPPSEPAPTPSTRAPEPAPAPAEPAPAAAETTPKRPSRGHTVVGPMPIPPRGATVVGPPPSPPPEHAVDDDDAPTQIRSSGSFPPVEARKAPHTPAEPARPKPEAKPPAAKQAEARKAEPKQKRAPAEERSARTREPLAKRTKPAAEVDEDRSTKSRKQRPRFESQLPIPDGEPKGSVLGTIVVVLLVLAAVGLVGASVAQENTPDPRPLLEKLYQQYVK